MSTSWARRRGVACAILFIGCGCASPSPPSPAGETLLYPEGAVHSPIGQAVVDSIREIAARNPAVDEHHYMKIGDSLTSDSSFMWPLAGAAVGYPFDLDIYTDVQADVDWFTDHPHDSHAAYPGTVTTWARDTTSPQAVGGVSPVDQEIAAMNPRFALLMFGTNDTANAGAFPDDPSYLHNHVAAMLDIVDYLSARGIVTILTTIPPNRNHTIFPTWWATTRGIAQGRRLPFIDLKQVLFTVPDWGLYDGIHLNRFPLTSGGAVFTPAGLQYGSNVRNLLTIEALGRARRALAGTAADATVLTLPATGTLAEPVPIAQLPFADMRNTEVRYSDVPGTYAVGPTKSYAGQGFAYEFTLTATAQVRATVFVRGAVDVDLFAFRSGTCFAGHDFELSFVGSAGTYLIVVDTVAGEGQAGEYLLTVVTE